MSNEHQYEKQQMEQLRKQEKELRAKLNGDQSEQLEKELAEVNASLQEQINVMKKLEERNTYSVITINLI